MIRNVIFSIFLFLFFLPVSASGGSDAASVPSERIPWSGYWWPRSSGKLVLGYSEHPSPLEKYDAYVSGYYPAEATTIGLEEEYIPDAYSWIGHCDDWAAASILEPEPDHPGDLLGIHFRVGDKKGLLTLHYDKNIMTVMYGNRYRDEMDDSNDIYPGGVNGFHQTLINHISYQGLPIIIDEDSGPQVWNYPAYAYEMNWTDEGNKRHVSCQVWLADDGVSPDFVGTSSFTQTYTYWLMIDEDGEVLDEPGQWEGMSIDNHPDFLWYPTFLGEDSFLKNRAVSEIVACEETKSDDRFEENDTIDDAFRINSLQKDRFYYCTANDTDWYKVALQQGDDFTAHTATSASAAMNLNLYGPNGEMTGINFYKGLKIVEVSETGYYNLRLDPNAFDALFYGLELFQSPSVPISHVTLINGWETRLTLRNKNAEEISLRLNLFDPEAKRIAKKEIAISGGALETVSLNQSFSAHASLATWLKIVNMTDQDKPAGFFTYEKAKQLVNLPIGGEGSRILYFPHINISDGWWTGIALLNLNAMSDCQVQMKAYNGRGQKVGEKKVILGPGQNRSEPIQSLWDQDFPQDVVWMEIRSDNLLNAFVLWGNQKDPNQPGLAGIPILTERQMNTSLYVPHLDCNNGWWTQIFLLNPNAKRVQLDISGYTSTGERVKYSSLSLLAYRSWGGEIQTLLEDWDERIAWIKITADGPVGGFQLFGRKMNQLAALVLTSDQNASSDLLVEYIPERDSWWTGLAILNPYSQKVDIYAEPFDKNGNRLIPEQYLWYHPPQGLAALNNAVGVLENFFSGIPTETAYLKIHAEGPVLGLGLYGDCFGERLDVLYLNESD